MKILLVLTSLTILVLMAACNKDKSNNANALLGKWAIRQHYFVESIFPNMDTTNYSNATTQAMRYEYHNDTFAVSFLANGFFNLIFPSHLYFSDNVWQKVSGNYSYQNDSLLTIQPDNSPFLSIIYSYYYASTQNPIPPHHDSVWVKQISDDSLIIHSKWFIYKTYNYFNSIDTEWHLGSCYATLKKR